jgi:hypothetical protein
MAKKRAAFLSEKMAYREMLQCAIDNVYRQLLVKYPTFSLQQLAKIEYSNPTPASHSCFVAASELQEGTEALMVGGAADLKLGYSEKYITSQSVNAKTFNAVKAWWPTKSDLFIAKYYDHIAVAANPKLSVWYAIKVSSTKASITFLKYCINSSILQQQLRLKEGGMVSRMIGNNSLDALQIPLPPLDIQQQIVNMLTPIEAAAEMEGLSERGFTRVEDLHKDVLQCAIDNVFEKLNDIRHLSLSSVASIFHPAANGAIRLSKKLLPEDKIFFDFQRFFPRYSVSGSQRQTATWYIDAEDLKTENEKKIVKSSVLEDQEAILLDALYLKTAVSIHGLYDDMTLACKPDTSILNFDFCRFFLISTRVYQNLEMLSTGTRGRTRLSTRAIHQLRIPIPPLEIQEQVAAYLSQIEESSKALKQNAIKASQAIFSADESL